MRSPAVKTIFVVMSFVILVGLACGSSGGGDPTATSEWMDEPEEPATEEISEPVVIPSPTEGILPTNTSPAPTEEIYEEPPAFFTEEFDGDLSSWSYFLVSGDENEMNFYQEDDYLWFDLFGEYIMVYLLYDEYTYETAKIEMLIENKGKNNNLVSLVCNYTDKFGWYEFNISSSGIYNIFVYSEIDGGFIELATGGSTHINLGRDTNVYTAVCDGNQLALYINGYLEREITDHKYNLTEGQVGFSMTSVDVLPIMVAVDYFSIDLP
jgi:hypothetical protein